MLVSITVAFQKVGHVRQGGMHELNTTSQCFQPLFDPDASTVELHHKDLLADIDVDVDVDGPAMPTSVSHQELFERWSIGVDVDEIKAVMVPEPVVF